jgi:hypothetical protein
VKGISPAGRRSRSRSSASRPDTLLDLLVAQDDVLAVGLLDSLDDVVAIDLLAGALVDPLVADRIHRPLVEPVEVDADLLRRRVEADRNVDQAEADGAFPDDSWHAVLRGVAVPDSAVGALGDEVGAALDVDAAIDDGVAAAGRARRGAASTRPRQAARWIALASSREAAAATLPASSRQRLPSQQA